MFKTQLLTLRKIDISTNYLFLMTSLLYEIMIFLNYTVCFNKCTTSKHPLMPSFSVM